MILSIVMIIIEMHPSLKSVVASVGVCFRNLEKHQKEGIVWIWLHVFGSPLPLPIHCSLQWLYHCRSTLVPYIFFQSRPRSLSTNS